MEGNLHYAWTRFLNGHWQTERPERPGSYPVADREGYEAGLRHVFDLGGLGFSESSVGGATAGHWQGWWWSEPVPAMPRPPEYPVELTEPEVQNEMLAQKIMRSMEAHPARGL